MKVKERKINDLKILELEGALGVHGGRTMGQDQWRRQTRFL